MSKRGDIRVAVDDGLVFDPLAGTERDGPALTTAVINALALNVTVPAGGVEASSHDVNFTLTGTVLYGSESDAAAASVASLSAVRNIRNNVAISHDADAVDVLAAVQGALDRKALILHESDVLVDTSGKTVTLTGNVRTWAEHNAVLDATWMTLASTTFTTGCRSLAEPRPEDRVSASRRPPMRPQAAGSCRYDIQQ
jgi:osmotically-inducible protein OsmY